MADINYEGRDDETDERSMGELIDLAFDKHSSLWRVACGVLPYMGYHRDHNESNLVRTCLDIVVGYTPVGEAFISAADAREFYGQCHEAIWGCMVADVEKAGYGGPLNVIKMIDGAYHVQSHREFCELLAGYALANMAGRLTEWRSTEERHRKLVTAKEAGEADAGQRPHL